MLILTSCAYRQQAALHGRIFICHRYSSSFSSLISMLTLCVCVCLCLVASNKQSRQPINSCQEEGEEDEEDLARSRHNEQVAQATTCCSLLPDHRHGSHGSVMARQLMETFSAGQRKLSSGLGGKMCKYLHFCSTHLSNDAN